MYKVTVQLEGKEIKSSAKDLLEAFNKLKLPEYPKTIGKLSVIKGEKKIEKVFNIAKLKRFARNEITREIWAKLFKPALG